MHIVRLNLTPGLKILLFSIVGQGLYSLSLLFVGGVRGADIIGQYSASLAFASVASIFCTLQLERTFVCSDPYDLVSKLRAIFVVSLIVSFCLWVGQDLYGDTIAIEGVVFFLLLIITANQVFYYVCVRCGALEAIAVAKLLQGGVSALGLAIILVMGNSNARNMLFALALGWGAALIPIIRNKKVRDFIISGSLRANGHVLKVFADNIKFIILMLPAMFFLVGIKDLVVLVMDNFYGPAFAGIFALLLVLVYQPIGMIGKAFSSEIGRSLAVGDDDAVVRKNLLRCALLSSVWGFICLSALLANACLEISLPYVNAVPLFFPVFLMALCSTLFGMLGPLVVKLKAYWVEPALSLGLCLSLGLLLFLSAYSIGFETAVMVFSIFSSILYVCFMVYLFWRMKRVSARGEG